jgi:hypothetical protein
LTRIIRAISLCLAVAFAASIMGHGWAEAGHDVGHASGWTAVSVSDHDDGSHDDLHIHVADPADDQDQQQQADGEMALGHHHQGADGHTGLLLSLDTQAGRIDIRDRLTWRTESIPATLRGDGPDMPPRPTRI